MLALVDDGTGESTAGGSTAGGKEAISAGRSVHPVPVRCRNTGCTGQDPKAMGCDQDTWTAAATWLYGTYVELRYSTDCQAAWGRISSASVGDGVRVHGPGGATEENEISYESDVYTPMVGAASPSLARACGELRTSKRGCTTPGGSTPVSVPQPAPSG